MELNHLDYFDRGYHEAQFCEIVLNLDKWFRRKCRLKTFHIRSSGGPLFSGMDPFLQYGRRHYEEQFCEIILNLDGSRDVIERLFLSRALVVLLFGIAEPLCIFVESSMRNHSVKLI